MTSIFELIRKFDTLDHKAICEELAIRDSTEFGAICNSLPEPFQITSWRAEVMALLSASSVIAAIRLVRTKTGCGLKEAKDMVDTMRGTHTGGSLNNATVNILGEFAAEGFFPFKSEPAPIAPIAPIAPADKVRVWVVSYATSLEFRGDAEVHSVSASEACAMIEVRKLRAHPTVYPHIWVVSRLIMGTA